VRVKVVDLCPGCHQNSFDLSQQAFAKIANLNAGRLTISARKYVFPTLLSLIKKTILFCLIHDSRLLGISVIWIWTV
jgi:expansin (peptidoglycan-binding protein)